MGGPPAIDPFAPPSAPPDVAPAPGRAVTSSASDPIMKVVAARIATASVSQARLNPDDRASTPPTRLPARRSTDQARPRWPRAPWDARSPERFSAAAVVGLAVHDPASSSPTADVGLVMRWTLLDDLSLRVDANAYFPGARVAPVYHLVSAGPLAISVFAPATFLQARRLSYAGFGAGAAATLVWARFALSVWADASWFALQSRVAPSTAGVESSNTLGIRPSAVVSVALSDRLRLGAIGTAQVFTTERPILVGNAFVSIEL